MKSLNNYIDEGFFQNVGSDSYNIIKFLNNIKNIDKIDGAWIGADVPAKDAVFSRTYGVWSKHVIIPYKLTIEGNKMIFVRDMSDADLNKKVKNDKLILCDKKYEIEIPYEVLDQCIKIPRICFIRIQYEGRYKNPHTGKSSNAGVAFRFEKINNAAFLMIRLNDEGYTSVIDFESNKYYDY